MSLTILANKRTAYNTAVDNYVSVKTNPASTQGEIDTAYASVTTAHAEYITAIQAARVSDPGLDWNQYFSSPGIHTMERLNFVRTQMHGRPPWVNAIPGPMILRYDTRGGSGEIPSNTAIVLHVNSGSNYSVDWGDGNVQSGLTGTVSHTYASAGIYDVKVSGSISGWDTVNGNDVYTLVDVIQWGTDCTINDYREMFRGMLNIQISAADAPDLSGVSRLDDMFNGCSNFNSDINHWNVSNIQYFKAMFAYCAVFNQPLNYWDTATAIDMQYMFINNAAFNQDISMWNVTNVVSTAYFSTGSGLSNAHNPFIA